MDPVLHKCKAVVPGVGRSGSGPYSTGRGLTEKRATTTRGAGSTQLSKYSPYIHPFPICKNWNFKNCTESSCVGSGTSAWSVAPPTTRASIDYANNAGKPFRHDGLGNHLLLVV